MAVLARAPHTVPRFLTVPEVANVLRRSPKAIYGLIERRRLPIAQKLAGRLLIDEADLLAWIAEERALSSKGQ